MAVSRHSDFAIESAALEYRPNHPYDPGCIFRVVAQEIPQAGLTDTGRLFIDPSLRYSVPFSVFLLRLSTLVRTISELSAQGNDWPTG